MLKYRAQKEAVSGVKGVQVGGAARRRYTGAEPRGAARVHSKLTLMGEVVRVGPAQVPDAIPVALWELKETALALQSTMPKSKPMGLAAQMPTKPRAANSGGPLQPRLAAGHTCTTALGSTCGAW